MRVDYRTWKPLRVGVLGLTIRIARSKPCSRPRIACLSGVLGAPGRLLGHHERNRFLGADVPLRHIDEAYLA